MPAFTPVELAYLADQPLGRIATAQPDGTLQVSPVSFRYNAELDTIDVDGYGMATSRKYRNVADNGRVAFVVDDLPSDASDGTGGWRPRCLEIRGRAEAIGEPVPLIRIYPERIIEFGIAQPFTSAKDLTVNGRNVTHGQ